MVKHYSIIKGKFDNQSMVSDFQKRNGYRLVPKNNVEYDGIMVNQLVIINQSFIEKVLKKKIKRKLDLYLKLIIDTLREEDTSSDAGVTLRNALNDLSRYRDIVEYKYQKYLDEKYVSLLLQKIALLEHELKQKLIYMIDKPAMEKEEKSAGGRRR
ncbi:MAG: hypothetical protein HFH09_02060 [Bacilli bacterium]|nr:hypothetical protein [Bacilli bacterium]